MRARCSIETARLVGEPADEGHFDELARLLQDPRVVATLGGMKTDGQVRKRATELAAHWTEHGFGQWVWRRRSDGELVGRGGLQHTPIDGQDEVEVGWVVVPALWNQGYATEFATAAMEFAVGTAGLGDVVAFTLPDNLASRRVMEKLGFSYEKEIVHAQLPHVLYRYRHGG